MQKQITVRQFGAPHGVLDLARKATFFTGDLRGELAAGPLKKIVLFEEAGGFTAQKAELVKQLISTRRSVAEAYLFTQGENISRVDGTMINNLALGPGQEHSHHFMSLLFLDWLLRQQTKPDNLTLIPEHFPSAEKADEILKGALRVKPLQLEGKDLTAILDEFITEQSLLKRQVSERDEMIADTLGQITIGQRQTNAEVFILIGDGHKGIIPSLEQKFSGKFNVSKQNTYAPVDVTSRIIDECHEGLDLESGARIILLGILARSAKNIFLQTYKDKLIKEPCADESGNTIFERLTEIVEALPIDTIYMLLQEWAGINCELHISSYPKKELPYPLDINMEVTLLNVSNVVKDNGMIDLSASEIGIFLDSRFVAHSLYLMLNVQDLKLRQLVEQWITSFNYQTLFTIKQELILHFQSGRMVACKMLQKIVHDLAQRRPKAMDNKTHQQLLSIFSRH